MGCVELGEASRRPMEATTMRRFLRIALPIGGLLAASLVLPFVLAGGERYRRAAAHLGQQTHVVLHDRLFEEGDAEGLAPARQLDQRIEFRARDLI